MSSVYKVVIVTNMNFKLYVVSSKW